MIHILAFIGLMVLLWLAGKMLTKFGNFMIRLSEALDDIVASTKSTKLPPKSNKIKNKIHIIKGEDTEDGYTEKVRKEIDEVIDELT